MELFNFYIATLLESGTIDKLLKEAQSVGMLNSKSCDGEGGSSGQYEPISMKNILSAFIILISGVGTTNFFSETYPGILNKELIVKYEYMFSISTKNRV